MDRVEVRVAAVALLKKFKPKTIVTDNGTEFSC
jgi:hypothetical protein